MKTKSAMLFLLSLLLCFCSTKEQNISKKWLTPYEHSGCLETPRYEQTIEYCQRLDRASTYVKLTDFGISPQDRKLPLLIVDFDTKADIT